MHQLFELTAEEEMGLALYGAVSYFRTQLEEQQLATQSMTLPEAVRSPYGLTLDNTGLSFHPCPLHVLPSLYTCADVCNLFRRFNDACVFYEPSQRTPRQGGALAHVANHVRQ